MAVDEERRSRLIDAMREAGLDALAFFSPAEVLLASGYWPVMGNSLAVLTREGNLTVLLPEDETELANASSDANLVSYKPASLEELKSLDEAIQAPLERLASSIDLRRGQIGFSKQARLQPVSYQAMNHFRVSSEELLHWAFPAASPVSADVLIETQMRSKTGIELDQLRRAGRRAGEGFRVAPEVIQVGRREYEVAAEIDHAFTVAGDGGFQRSKGYFFCMSGPNSYLASGAYARTRTRRIEKGDVVMIHANTVGDGFWTDITRTYIAGDPSPEQRAIYDAISEARRQALAAVRPGVAASQVDHAARSVLEQAGFGSAFKHATGHGVGFAAADANARPRIHPKNPEHLVSGSTFNIEPAVYLERIGGFRHCDVVACTERGVEVLTDFQQEEVKR